MFSHYQIYKTLFLSMYIYCICRNLEIDCTHFPKSGNRLYVFAEQITLNCDYYIHCCVQFICFLTQFGVVRPPLRFSEDIFRGHLSFDFRLLLKKNCSFLRIIIFTLAINIICLYQLSLTNRYDMQLVHVFLMK